MIFDRKTRIFVERLRRAGVFRSFAIFLMVAWGSVTILDTIGDNLGLPNWVELFLLFFWISIFPVFAYLTWKAGRLQAVRGRPSGAQPYRFLGIISEVVVILVLIAFPMSYLLQYANEPASAADTPGEPANSITIASKTFPESSLMLEVMALMIEDRHPEIRVERAHYAGETPEVLQQFLSGYVDLWVDYSGTILSIYLEESSERLSNSNFHTRYALENLVANHTAYHRATVLPYLGFSNNYTLVGRSPLVRAALGNDAAGWTMSQLAEHSRNERIRFAVNYGFLSRPRDGLSGLVSTYEFNMETMQMFHEDAYEALREDRADIAIGFTTDPQLSTGEFAHLRDDRNYWPHYRAYPVLRRSYVTTNPEIVDTLNLLEDRFTPEEISFALRQLEQSGFNRETAEAGDLTAIQEIARGLLEREGLL